MKVLGHADTQKLLEKYQLPYAKEYVCRNLFELLRRARELRMPLVLKAISEEATHKTDKGLVRTGIHDVPDLHREFSKLERILKSQGIRGEGFLLQEQKKGVEFIVGGKEDPTFGNVLLFGLGGIFVEMLKQRAVRVLPVDRKELEKMVHETPAPRFFEGYRGFKVSEHKLVGVLEKSAKLISSEKIAELDLNPVIANESESVVVDARIVVW